MLKKFEVNQGEQIKSYYDENGYVIIRNALPDSLINSFLEKYEEIKTNPRFVYYSQSFQTCMRPELNDFGLIKESMQNASRLGFFKNFSQAFQNCIYSSNVSKALENVTGFKKHVSWQNMFFDSSTGTLEHQDSWYLDTEPAGNLVGVWYALENIEEASGPFFVSPGSHKIGLLKREDYPAHEDFVEAVRLTSVEKSLETSKMLLDKGDILLWHPFTIHGALQNQDPHLSRKSFTSHFYPMGLKAKDIEQGKLVSIYDHEHPKKTCNPDIFSAYRYDDRVYSLLVYAKYFWDQMKRKKEFFVMRRDSNPSGKGADGKGEL